MSLHRVLIACRGRLARRLVTTYRRMGIETVAAFSEPDAEQGYLDDADYDAYLVGSSVADTYNDAGNVLSAAMDAGCDAIHPGRGPLAGTPELVTLAANANVGIIGADPQYLLEVIDRALLADRVRAMGLSWSDASASATDERLAAVVVGDRHGAPVVLGHLDRTLQHRGRVWLAELSSPRPSWPEGVLTEATRAVASDTHWIGVGTLNWRVVDTTAAMHHFSARLPTGWDLVEAVQGIDLIEAQLTAVIGQPLGWEQPPQLSTTGLQVRIWHGDPGSGDTDEGVLEVDLPQVEGVDVALGVDRSTPCSALTDPLLLTLTAVHDDRRVALAALREAVESLRVGGVSTNLAAVRALLATPVVADRRTSSATVQQALSSAT